MKNIMINGTKMNNVVPKGRNNMDNREHGFRASTFCPIPIGDSPSSKRMYDVLHFGCIPVVLSDDLVWAFSPKLGGELDPRSFAIQLPQSVVQFPAHVLMKKFGSGRGKQFFETFGKLPAGESLFSLLEQASKMPVWENGVYVNPLIQILRLVSPQNVEILSAGVQRVAPYFRFYAMNSSMDTIPTATHTFPDGGAITMMAKALSKRKAEGIDRLRDECQAERLRKHKYIGRYPCDKDDETSLKRRLR